MTEQTKSNTNMDAPDISSVNNTTESIIPLNTDSTGQTTTLDLSTDKIKEDNVVLDNNLFSSINILSTTSTLTAGQMTPTAMLDQTRETTHQLFGTSEGERRETAHAPETTRHRSDRFLNNAQPIGEEEIFPLINTTAIRNTTEDATAVSTSQNDLLQQIAYLIKSNTDSLKFEIKSNNDIIKLEMGQIKSEINATNSSLRVFTEQINYKITDLTNSHETIKLDLNHLKENQAHLASQLNQLETQVENQLVEHVNEMRDDLIKDLSAQNNTFSIQIQRISQDAQISNQNTRVNIEQHASKLTHMQQTLLSYHEQLETLEDKLNKQPTVLPTTIQVTCTGGNNSPIDQAIPKFHGRAHNPREYLSKLKRYYERHIQNDNTRNTTERLHEVIELSLESHALRWFELIKSNITNWNNFQEAFETKYWSYEVQRGIRQRMEVEKYRLNGKLSRAEYFVERVLLLRSTTPTPSEEEIITCLSEHFSELIQDARRVQNITTIASFEQLLQREDLKDAHQRSRNNYQSTSNNRPNNYNQQSYNQCSSPPYNQQNRYHQNSNQDFNNRYPNRTNNPRNNNGNNQPNSSRPNYNNYRSHPPNNYNNRNYNNQYRNPNNERRYPTQEQHEVCHTIVEQTPPDSTTPEQNTNTSLNE